MFFRYWGTTVNVTWLINMLLWLKPNSFCRWRAWPWASVSFCFHFPYTGQSSWPSFLNSNWGSCKSKGAAWAGVEKAWDLGCLTRTQTLLAQDSCFEQQHLRRLLGGPGELTYTRHPWSPIRVLQSRDRRIITFETRKCIPAPCVF